jgi:hypothetical protein
MSMRDQLRAAKFAQKLAADDSVPFREHAWLVEQAKTRRPADPKAIVSSFAGWVFDLCHLDRPDDPAARAEGKAGESLIEKRQQMLAKATPPIGESLRLIFADPLDGSANPFQIGCLTLKGKPLHGLPDVVLENKGTGEIFIFERKITRHNVPETGWPNLKVQLWCYGCIDQWQDAPEVYLLGQIWRSHNWELTLSRKVPRWRRSDPTFHKECEELFSLFGGQFAHCSVRDKRRKNF